MTSIAPAGGVSLARAEQRRADPHRSRAEANGDLEIGAHAHRETRQAVAGGNLGGEGEVRPGRLVLWRDAHQALDGEAKLAAAAGDEGVGVGGRDPGLLRLFPGVDLDIEA